jgi:tetratricopeptide (TPR) repeat protein
MPDDAELGFALVSPYDGWLPLRTKLALIGRLRRLPVPTSRDIRLDLSEAAVLAHLGDPARAREVLARAQARAKELGARGELGWLVREEGEVIWIAEAHGVEALPRFEEAARIFAELGDIEELETTKGRIATLLTNLGPPQRALASLDEVASLSRRLGNHQSIEWCLTARASQFLLLGELKDARRALDEARAEAEVLDEPPGWRYQSYGADLAVAKADLDEARRAINDLKALGEERVRLVAEGVILREEDRLEEARESLLRAAKLFEQQGVRLASTNLARRACELHCDEGRAAEGLACLAEHPLVGMSEGHTAAGLLIEAKCRYQTGDLAAAERAGNEALSKTDLFARRVEGTALLMRVLAARGETASSLTGLRGLVANVDAKPGNRRLEFEVALALGEVEIRAGRPEGRARLLKLEQEAKSREFFRIARLAREAREGGLSKAHAAAPAAPH